MGLNVKLLGKISENLQDVGVGKEVLDVTPETESIKGKTDKLALSKFFSAKEDEKTHQRWRGSICKPYVMEGQYLENIKNSQNSTGEKANNTSRIWATESLHTAGRM